MIQRPWQRGKYIERGSNILFIDGTHNTTMYENIDTDLFACAGHGIPVAWMIASKGTAETIGYFISLVQSRSLLIMPRWLMSGRDLAQIKALLQYFPASRMLLCWWHVLRAWQQHFVTSHTTMDKTKSLASY